MAKLADLARIQRLWNKIKNTFVAKDSSGNVTVSGRLTANEEATFNKKVNILASEGLSVDNDITTGGNVVVKDGAVVVTAEDYETLCTLTCSSDGKLLSNEIALATVNDVTSAVNTAVANAGHLKREKVTTLPGVSTASENVIYMVPATDGSGNDVFDEYMKIDDKLEKIGSNRVDLSGYPTTEQMNTAISNSYTLITDAEIDALT